MSILQNKRAIYQVIGCLMQQPSLLREANIKLSKEDFPELFHKIAFGAIENLYFAGTENIDLIGIENFLSAYDKQYEIFDNNNGMDYLQGAMEKSDLSNFEYNYNIVKKFTLLRDYVDLGFDVTEIYDSEETNIDLKEKKTTKFNNMSIQDINNFFNLKVLGIKRKWNSSESDAYGFNLHEGMRELLEKRKLAPDIGHPFSNPVMTTLTRGMRRKKFMLRSGSTGSGKSRQSMADACNVAIPFIYDIKENKWVKNGSAEKALYISTELEKEEVQTVFLAYLSGVDEEHINLNTYQEGEEERVIQALELFEKYDLHCEYIAEFDADDIEEMIERHIIENDVGYVFFDYIHETVKMMSSFATESKMSLRSDQVLYMFGAKMKKLANEYNVFISSGTQLNDNYNENDSRNERALRGAKSLGDKLDIGVISLKPNARDIKLLGGIIANHFGKVPNMCHTFWKNRGNKYKDVILWTHMDLGNVREESLFLTTTDYKILPIEALQVFIEENEDVEETPF